MSMGIYDIYLQAISNINVLVLIPMGIGLSIGGFIILKIIDYCFKKYYSETYYSIIGFVIGSVFILLPSLTFSLDSLISIIIFILGFLIGVKFETFNT